MVSILGALFIAATCAALLFRRQWLPWILSTAVPFSATAGLTIAGQSITVYPIVALVLVPTIAQQYTFRDVLESDVSGKRGLQPLVAFGAWAAIVTAVGPAIFAGTPVLDPRQGIDDGVGAPASLGFAISNVAQAGYVVIGIATVIAVGVTGGISARLPAAAFSVGTILSSARDLLPDSLQKSLFDNSENVSYTAGEFNGVERMRGIFSEPSSLGSFSVAAATFFVTSAGTARGPLRLLYLCLGTWSAINAVLSFSGGAVVTGLIVLGLVVAYGVTVRVTGRRGFSSAAVVLSFFLTVVAFVVAPFVYAFVSLLLNDKTDSESYANRSAADSFSFSLSGDTLGIGVGLGSNRPSSFLPSLLSTTGVIGVVFFAGAAILVVFGAMKTPSARPAAWAFIAFMVSKLTAGPDTSDPPMWFLFAVCANAAWSSIARTELGLGPSKTSPHTEARAALSPTASRQPS